VKWLQKALTQNPGLKIGRVRCEKYYSYLDANGYEQIGDSKPFTVEMLPDAKVIDQSDFKKFISSKSYPETVPLEKSPVKIFLHTSTYLLFFDDGLLPMFKNILQSNVKGVPVGTNFAEKF
jgi:hypothetical protein